MTIQGISCLLCPTKISTCVAHRTLELVGGTRANEVHLCPLAVQKYLLSKSLTYEYGHVNDTRVHPPIREPIDESFSLYLNHDGEDQRLAVEFFEDIAFGNVTDYSPDVCPVCDIAFLIRKRFCYFFL